MPNVDERVVSMQFDNSEFDPKLKKSQKTFEEFEKSLSFDKGSKALKNFEKNMDKFDTKSMSDKLGALGKSFSALENVAVGALRSVGVRLENFINKALKTALTEGATKGWGDYGEKVTAVQTIMAATSTQFKDTETQIKAVNGQLDDLRIFADETSYSFKDMTNNIGKFTSQGVDLRTSVRAMEGISTWAALSGAGTAQAEHAMYNLSQALAVGYIQRLDWRSIDNANMSTLEFKQTAIDTALALGTLKEVGEGVYETLSGKRGGTTVLFQDLLSEGWFTSKVLLKSLDRYGGFAKEILEYTKQMSNVSVRDAMRWIDEYVEGTLNVDAVLNKAGDDAELVVEMLEKLGTKEYDLGRRAFRAAQETKTFAEALNYTKEAVATGWSQTWELIFGDYNEARKFWSDITDDLYELFVAGGEFRNNVLELWSKTFGRKDFIDGIQAIREFIFGTEERKGIRDYIREAWQEIFPFWKSADNIASALVRLTRSFKEWAENLELTSDQVYTLRAVVRFLASALKFTFSLVRSIWIFVSPFLRWTWELLNALSSIFATLFEGAGAILDNETALKGFRIALLALGAALAFPIKLLTIFINWLKSLGNKTLPEVLDKLNSFWISIKNFFKLLANRFLKVGSDVVKGFWIGFSATWNAVSTAIYKAFNTLVDGVKRIFKIHSPSLVFYALGGFVALGFVSGVISALIVGRGDILKGFKIIFETISAHAKGVWSSLMAFTNKYIKPWFGTVGAWFKSVFSSIGGWFAKIGSGVQETAVKIGNWFKRRIDEAGGWDNALKLLVQTVMRLAVAFVVLTKAIQGIKLKSRIIDLVGSFASLNFGLARLAHGAANAMEDLAYGLRKMYTKQGTAQILKAFGDVAWKVALSITVLAGAFVALANVPLNNVKEAGIALASLAGGLLVFMTVLSLIAKLFNKNTFKDQSALEVTGDNGPIKKLITTFKQYKYVNTTAKAVMRYAVAMIGVAGAVALLMVPLRRLAELMDEYNNDYKKLWIAMGMLASLIAVIGISMGLMAKVSGKSLPSILKLALQWAIMNKLVKILVETFKEVYPYLIEFKNFIIGVFSAIKDGVTKLVAWIKEWPDWAKALGVTVIIIAWIVGFIAAIARLINGPREKVEKKPANLTKNVFMPIAASMLGLAAMMKVMGGILKSLKGEAWSSYGPAMLTLVGSAVLLMLAMVPLLLALDSVMESLRITDTSSTKTKIKSAIPVLALTFGFLIALVAEVGGLVYLFNAAGLTWKDMIAPGILIAAVSVLLLSLAVLMNVIGKAEIDANKLKAINRMIIGILLLTSVVFGVLIAFTFMDPQTVWTAVKQVSIILGALAAFIVIVSSMLALVLRKGDSTNISKAMGFFIGIFVLITVVFALLTALTWFVSPEQMDILRSAVISFGILALALAAFAAAMAAISLIKINGGAMAGAIIAILALCFAFAVIIDPLLEIAKAGNSIWPAIGAMAAILAILELMVLGLVGLGALLTSSIPVLLGFVIAIASLWLLIGAIMVLAEPLKTLADSLKYFRDTIGAGALVVGLELLGFAALAALAGVLLAIATPFLILGGIGLLAFAGALILMGTHAKEIQAAMDIFKSFSWRTLGGMALFALGVLALGIAFRVLGLGALFAAGAFAAFTAAFIYMGKNIDWVKKSFEGFKEVTWEVVGGMAKLALGIAALSIALGILAVPLTAILIPIAGIIGLTNLLINSLIKLGEKVNLFAAAIDVVHEKLDKISTIIVAFGTALGSVAEPLKNFGYAALILGAGIIVMGAGIIVAAVGMLLLVGVLFLFKLVLDGIKKDHPRLYDTIMSIAEGLAEVESNIERIETALTSLLTSGISFVSSWVDLFTQIPDTINTALDFIKSPFKGLTKWMSGEHDTIKLMTAQAEANAKMAAAQADLAKALKDVDFEKLVQVMFRYNAAVQQLGKLATDYWKDMRLLSDSMNMLFYSMAADIIQGLLDGIEDKLVKLEGMSRRMARVIINTVKKEMDINSPSRVMHQIGEDIVEGEMNGIDDMYDIAMEKFRKKHEKMVEIAKETANTIEKAYTQAYAASGLAEKKARFDKLDTKLKTKGQRLTNDEWTEYYKLQNELVKANQEYYKLTKNVSSKEKKALMETGSRQSRDVTTFKDALSNIGRDIGSIWSDLKSGKITFKEALSQLWGTIKTNGGSFLGDKFDQVKEWLIGDNGILSGFKDLLDPSKLFKSLDLENLLPKDDDDDPWKNMQDNFGQPGDLSGLDNVSGSGQGTINTYEFVQNNYSPKALSRIEIYRQTNRQFNNFRTREVLAR